MSSRWYHKGDIIRAHALYWRVWIKTSWLSLNPMARDQDERIKEREESVVSVCVSANVVRVVSLVYMREKSIEQPIGKFKRNVF